MRMDALHKIAVGLTSDARFRHGPLVVKGGTGLVLAYDLPRPSTDLDLTCLGRVDKEKVLQTAVEVLGRERGRTFARADIKQRGHGYIRLQWEDNSVKGKFAIETSIDVLSEDALATIENTVLRNGFRVFSLPVMAETKLQTLVGVKTRRRARDLYDAAWLMENHMEVVAPATRLRLWKQMEVDVLENLNEWEEAFFGDEIMARATLDEVWDNLDSSLRRDPVVMHHDAPEGSFCLEKKDESVVLYFGGGNAPEKPVGQFESNEGALGWLDIIDPDHTLPRPNASAMDEENNASGLKPQ